jgi:hypothetical protein
MACRGRESAVDDEIVQELHADRLSGLLSDCESDKSSNDDDEDYDFGPSASQKGRTRARLEVSDSDVNILMMKTTMMSMNVGLKMILYCSILLHFSLSSS